MWYGTGDTPTITANNSLLTSSSSSGSSDVGWGGVASSVIGALTSAYGAYSSVNLMKDNLEFQSQMLEINARMNEINSRMAERSAQSALKAGETAQNQVSLRYGMIKSSQKVSQAARGITIGVGSAAEEIASTDLVKEMDMNTILRNSVSQANAIRTQSLNYSTEAMNNRIMSSFSKISTSSLSPYMAAGTSLLNSGAAVARQWYLYQNGGTIL